MTAIACETISSCLKDLPGGSRTTMSILTYDSQVHFYQISGEITKQKMYVMSAVDDPHILSPLNKFVVNISESEGLITELLEQYQFLISQFEIFHNELFETKELDSYQKSNIRSPQRISFFNASQNLR